MWDELCSLRFVDRGHNVVIMGPVGVGKTFLATALRPRCGPPSLQRALERTGRLLKWLIKASRLDNSNDAEMRKLLHGDLLILDEFCVQPLDAADTADVYDSSSSGDSNTDVAVFRPSTGQWLVYNGTTTTWGASGDKPTPGY